MNASARACSTRVLPQDKAEGGRGKALGHGGASDDEKAACYHCCIDLQPKPLRTLNHAYTDKMRRHAELLKENLCRLLSSSCSNKRPNSLWTKPHQILLSAVDFYFK